MIKLTYVVVNYFSHAKVARLIQSISPCEGLRGIVVDNSQDDDEYASLCAALDRKDVQCMQAERNGGFSYGTNIGINACLDASDAVLILNPDTTVAPDFFGILMDITKSLPDVAVSPHGVKMDTGKIWSAGGRFYWFRGRADVLTRARPSGETDFGTCACLLVPSAAIKDIGLLDEDFFLGGEEWDYSLRLRKGGWPIIYSSQAKYSHEVSGTHEKYGLRFFYIGMRTKVLFCRKHYGLLFWPWLLCFFLPSAPLLLWKNSRLKHGKPLGLARLFCLATLRSARMKRITQIEYKSEGRIAEFAQPNDVPA